MHTNPEVLALLALGEDSATADERAHVDSCSVCTQEVAELAHLAGVGRAVQDAAPLSSPRAEVWDRIRAEIGFGTSELNDLHGVDPATPATPAAHAAAADSANGSSSPGSPSALFDVGSARVVDASAPEPSAPILSSTPLNRALFRHPTIDPAPAIPLADRQPGAAAAS